MIASWFALPDIAATLIVSFLPSGVFLALLVAGLVEQLVCLVNVLREAFKFRILVFLEDAGNQGGCTRLQTITELV